MNRPNRQTDSGRLSASEHSRSITIYFDGHSLGAQEGQTVAAALLAAGITVFRYTFRYHKPRGLFCGMGVCYECLVNIDGETPKRACLIKVRDGMRISTLLDE